MLFTENLEVGEIHTRQEDSLSPLVFIQILIPLTFILSKASASGH